MKKNLFSLVLFILLQSAKSQIVFCPPGAQWHFLFGGAFNAQTSNEKAFYIRDSILNAETVKVIYHTRFFVGCVYNFGTPPYNWYHTVIKQKGDTVFMRNNFTQHQWQILYNFAALPGDIWTNALGAPGSVYYKTRVDSVKTTVINNFTLRQLYVTQDYCGVNSNSVVIQTKSTITERIGFNGHLFPFNCYMHEDGAPCEAEPLKAFLCYSDDTFGLKQFTALGCNATGIEEKAWNPYGISIFPNPGNNTVNLKSSRVLAGENTYVSFTDVHGREIQRLALVPGDNTFEVNDFSNGIYMINIIHNNESIYKAKFFKQD